MTINELQRLQYLLKIFLDYEWENYQDIDELEILYNINRIKYIIKDKELNNLPISTTTNR